MFKMRYILEPVNERGNAEDVVRIHTEHALIMGITKSAGIKYNGSL